MGRGTHEKETNLSSLQVRLLLWVALDHQESKHPLQKDEGFEEPAALPNNR